MPQHEDQPGIDEAPDFGGGDRPVDGVGDAEPDADVDNVLASIEQELSALVERCEQTTAQHARELTQRQAEIDRTIQIAMKRQVEIDRRTTELRRLADEVVAAEASLGERRRALAERLRRRRAWMDERLTAAVDQHARRAAQELEARAQELAERETQFSEVQSRLDEQAEAVESERAKNLEVRRLIEEQATMTASHADAMDAHLAKRDQASLELLEQLRDACGLADRVRELSNEVRESRLEVRESAERVEHAEREQAEARSSLEAARARIAQLEHRIEELSRDNLLREQRAARTNHEIEARHARLDERERRLNAEAERLASDQAACDDKLRELGHGLIERDRAARALRLDPRTPLAVSSLGIPVSPRRRPDIRLVN